MDRKEYQRQYYLKNKERIINRVTEYNNNNKDKKLLYQKNYRDNNKNKLKEKDKKYLETPDGKKSRIKRRWKSRGLDMDTFYYVYPIFLKSTHCERCGVEFEEKNNKNQKCMDHCHSTGMFRNVICRACNQRIRAI